MKLNKTASGKVAVTLTKAEWINIGKQGGFFRKAQADLLAPPSHAGAPSSDPMDSTVGDVGGLPSDGGLPGEGVPTDPAAGAGDEHIKTQIIDAVNAGDFGKAKQLMEGIAGGETGAMDGTEPNDAGGADLSALDNDMGHHVSGGEPGLGETHEPPHIPLMDDKSELDGGGSHGVGKDLLNGLGKGSALAGVLPSSRQVKKASRTQAGKF
jgi:hypothetical protein